MAEQAWWNQLHLCCSPMAKVQYAIPSHYRQREDGWIYLARPLDLCPGDLFSAPQALGGSTLPPKAESCTCIARDKFSNMSQSRTQPHGAWSIFCKSYMITDWFREVVDAASPARGKCGSSLSSEAWIHWREQRHPGNLQQPGLNAVQAARGMLGPGLCISLILWTLGDEFFFYIIWNCPPLHTYVCVINSELSPDFLLFRLKLLRTLFLASDFLV